jgi:hypothetical protein
LNPRPPGYEPGELPDCSTPRQVQIRKVANLSGPVNPVLLGAGSPEHVLRVSKVTGRNEVIYPLQVADTRLAGVGWGYRSSEFRTAPLVCAVSDVVDTADRTRLRQADPASVF